MSVNNSRALGRRFRKDNEQEREEEISEIGMCEIRYKHGVQEGN